MSRQGIASRLRYFMLIFLILFYMSVKNYYIFLLNTFYLKKLKGIIKIDHVLINIFACFNNLINSCFPALIYVFT